MDAETTPGKHRGRPFPKGRSGNPAGRPKGARNRATLAAEALLDGEAEALARRAVEMALAGDATALRLCLERILPPRKDRTVSLSLPPIHGPADLVAALNAILQGVAQGAITPAEAAILSGMIAATRPALGNEPTAAPVIQLNWVSPES